MHNPSTLSNFPNTDSSKFLYINNNQFQKITIPHRSNYPRPTDKILRTESTAENINSHRPKFPNTLHLKFASFQKLLFLSSHRPPSSSSSSSSGWAVTPGSRVKFPNGICILVRPVGEGSVRWRVTTSAVFDTPPNNNNYRGGEPRCPQPGTRCSAGWWNRLGSLFVTHRDGCCQPSSSCTLLRFHVEEGVN